MKGSIHVHHFNLPSGENGPCISKCRELHSGELFVYHETKATQVNFCPACGYEAKRKIVEVPNVPMKL
jgi:hypothetical protein